MASKSTKKKGSAETSPKPAQDAEIRQENIDQRSHIGAVGGAAAGAATGAAFGSVVPAVGTVFGGLLGGLFGAGAGYVAGAQIAANESPPASRRKTCRCCCCCACNCSTEE